MHLLQLIPALHRPPSTSKICYLPLLLFLRIQSRGFFTNTCQRLNKQNKIHTGYFLSQIIIFWSHKDDFMGDLLPMFSLPCGTLRWTVIYCTEVCSKTQPILWCIIGDLQAAHESVVDVLSWVEAAADRSDRLAVSTRNSTVIIISAFYTAAAAVVVHYIRVI